jgi:copper(I)-binding protein
MPLRTLYRITLTLALFGATPALAHNGELREEMGSLACDCPPGVELVTAPWVRLVPPGAPATAAYFSLRNGGHEDLLIVSGTSPAAEVTELHDHSMDASGVMRMRRIDGIPLPAERIVELEPGGLHVMLIGLREPLVENQRVAITLVTDTGATLHFEASVLRGAQPKHEGAHPAHPHHHHRH